MAFPQPYYGKSSSYLSTANQRSLSVTSFYYFRGTSFIQNHHEHLFRCFVPSPLPLLEWKLCECRVLVWLAAVSLDENGTWHIARLNVILKVLMWDHGIKSNDTE